MAVDPAESRDVDSAGVYYMSVEDFERRRPVPPPVSPPEARRDTPDESGQGDDSKDGGDEGPIRKDV